MKPQASPKLAKGDRTRQRVLETATSLMAEKGPDIVSMREIAARLKITKRDAKAVILALLVSGLASQVSAGALALTLDGAEEQRHRGHSRTSPPDI